MSKKQYRIVFKKENGSWANKRIDKSKASNLHRTQSEAEMAAREMLKNQGGGELITNKRDRDGGCKRASLSRCTR